MIDPAAIDSSQLFWITSRAAGIAALLLASASVATGVAHGAGWIGRERGRDLRPLHEALSIATLVAIAVHGLALLGDTYIGFSIAEIAVPFLSSYAPLWTGIGITAGWLFAALGLSYYARGRIGPKRWRSLHRLTAVVWLAAVGHSLAAGTDSGSVWFILALAAIGLPAAAMPVARWRARLSPSPAAAQASANAA